MRGLTSSEPEGDEGKMAATVSAMGIERAEGIAQQVYELSLGVYAAHAMAE
jgi:hypothetical protein